MRKIKRHVAAPLAILAGGLVLAACYGGNTSGPGIVIGGDSITVDSTAAIQSTLNGQYQTDIEATAGYTWSQEAPTIESSMSSDTPAPSAVIVNLGTDDATNAEFGNESTTAWEAPFDTFISDAASVHCVVLWTINDNGFGTLGAAVDPVVANAINSEIASLVSSDPSHYSEVDWNALVKANPGWLQSDGIHPNATGEQEIADWDAIALASNPCNLGSL